MIEKELKVQGTAVFDKVWRCLSDPWKILVLRGGTRSSKTYSVVQIILIWLISGDFGVVGKESGVCHIVRKHKSTLKETVMRDFEELIDLWNVRNPIEINKTDRTYKIEKRDAAGKLIFSRLVEFIGAYDQQKLRGAKRDIFYCNEANELGYLTEFFQLLIRTMRKIIIDFNPSDEDIWINTELEMKRQFTQKDVIVIVSTYKDNRFLSADEVREIENIKNIDQYFWKGYGEGGYGKTQGVVYTRRDIIDEVPVEAEYIVHGLDFGFTNDPTALAQIFRYDGKLVLDELIHETSLTNPDLSKQMTQLNVPRNCEIIADCAEPKSIEELSRLGRDIRACQKVSG